MCVIAFSFAQTGLPPLVLASNRDEFYARPTRPAHWWDGGAAIFGGRDELAGGSWLAASPRGRLAAVTNHRRGAAVAASRSRGGLVAEFLDSATPVDAFARRIAAQADHYAGFNLLLFDFEDRPLAWYVSDRGEARALAPGLYGLSNDRLDTPWPKVERLRSGLARTLSEDARQRRARLFEHLLDRTVPPAPMLPDSGVGPARERYLAPVFIGADANLADPLGGYGTRASSVVEISADRVLRFSERSWTVPGAPDAGCTARDESFAFAA